MNNIEFFDMYVIKKFTSKKHDDGMIFVRFIWGSSVVVISDGEPVIW